MITMINILIVLFYLFILNEILVYIVYGKFVSKETEYLYSNLDINRLKLNSHNHSILRNSNTTSYITNVPFSIFSRYYISECGTIPRWSKLHTKVKEYFVIANNNLKRLRKEELNLTKKKNLG